MKLTRNSYFLCTLLSILLINVSCVFDSTKPIVEYESDNSMIRVIQTDIDAHDTCFISIDDVYRNALPIKDTINISILETIKSLNQIKVAHKLATQNNQLKVIIRTTRTNDTIFLYKFKSFDIKPIKVAEIISGQCKGLYDVNSNRDYHEKIRQWLFENDITPDSSIIENTNKIIRQFNYSGKNEYGTLSGSLPIVPNLYGQKYRFKTQMQGDYFYLYAYACGSGTPVKTFIESKISKGLTDAHCSINDEFSCSNNGNIGPNVLFLIGIDKNWKYEVLPVGIVVVDNVAPKIISLGRINPLFIGKGGLNKIGSPTVSWSNKVTMQSQNLQINIPAISANIFSTVNVSYGSFEGYDYFGYDIPFYIDIDGDVKSITIGSHMISEKSIKSGECVRLHFKKLHVGDNMLPITATDNRGNKSIESLSIPIRWVSSNNDDDDDYNDLEDRISDLEDRIDDLE